MTNKEKLEKILNRCKASITLIVNQHKDYYMTAEEYLKEENEHRNILKGIDKEVYNKIIETNNIINLHFYPNTPIGFYEIYHYDLDKCLDIAIEMLEIGDQDGE